MSQGTETAERLGTGRATGDDSGVSARADVVNMERLDTSLARRYHLTRLVIAGVMFLVSLALVFAWEWPVGLFVAGVAMGAAADAWMRFEGRWSRSARLPLVVDSTAIGAATVLGQLPAEVVIIPFSYIFVSAFAMLKVRTATWFVLYPTIWLVVHLLLVGSGDWSETELWIIRAVGLLTYLPGMVAVLISASGALQSAERLDRQLVVSERQLELAITGAPLVLFEYNPHGIFTLSEGAGLEKLGLVPGEVVGLSALEVYADVPGVLSAVERSLRGESFSEVVQLGDAFFQVQYRAQFDEDGSLERVIGVATDVSERVAAEAALEALVRSKDEFVATIAHELRTPLTAVVGLSEELRSSHQVFKPAEIAEFIDMIADQSHEVAAIVEDLLVAARADIGKVSVISQKVDLQRVVEGVLTETNHLRTSTTRSIVFEEARGWAVADPQRVRQILRNLVTNAFRYGGEDVWIEVDSTLAWCKIVVADSGPGISESEREAIFEPFRRAHDTPGLPGSLGLGLSVARKLAEMMDGTLSYRHTGGRSEFELALPAGPEQ
ncbi:MAG: PAS domain-containing sensor histidine kinase [Acidimicrobiia bacterium]|nr:PAS domain-containing sensor histidine kinase [Acidimicrobiia bacterium]MDH3397015.1 PAS domain-containing sensor histidine kinase [Acidimicrobiia bacterium]